ncbi:hypothetical protein GCM10027615_71240 [Plantactinospora veratri]
MDPEYPVERLGFVLGDTGVSVVLTQEGLLGRLPVGVGVEVLCLDRDWGWFEAGSPLVSGGSGVGAGNVAYVMYTSGSTGRPKGVVIQHGGLVNFAHELRWTPKDPVGRVALNASIAFDQSLDTLLALCHGWEIVIVPESVRLAPADFLGWLARNPVDVLETTPSQLEPLLRQGLAKLPQPPSTMLVSGEAIDSSLWKQLYELTDMTIWNSYGPTECTIDTTVARIGDSPQPNIGRPIANMRVLILDEWWEPVPVGVAGEVFLGGVGLARGYLGRAGLTASRFVPDPFGGEVGGRLYRTGDVGRFRADGVVEFLGRVDEQVKVRGYRVEPGEVEAVLVGLVEVSEAVVVVRDDGVSGRRLVAYVVPAVVGVTPGVSVLRAALSRVLPEYMVPSVFVWLAALPLTANGKLDRRALPVPVERPELEVAFEAPRSVTERVLAGLWVELLGVDRVGVHDNFFELGGHSLLMMQLLWRLQEQFGAEVPLELLFEASTVAELASALDDQAMLAGRPTD